MGKVDRGFTIAVSNFLDVSLRLDGFKNGLDHYISKPIDLKELDVIVDYLLF